MAEKGWTTQASAAAGIAAGAGAAQLGLGYGLGVITWPTTAAEAESVWLGSLGWATWITASATVLGAVIAGRMRPDRTGPWRALWRFLLAASSALGALVSVALVALPARSAVRADTLSPQLVAGGYALAGLLAGLVVAFWAVSSGPVAANLIGTALWLWALAIAGVAAELATGRDFATYLTSWQFAESVSPIRYGGIYWPSALLTLVAAFVIGLAAAWPAARNGELGLGTAISGAVGPLLVAFSFLLLAPQLTAAMGPLQSAYLIAPYAVLAGLGGSALTVTLEQGRRARAARAVDTAAIPTTDLTAGGKPGPGPAIPATRPAPAAVPAPTPAPASAPSKAPAAVPAKGPAAVPAKAPAKATGRAVAPAAEKDKPPTAPALTDKPGPAEKPGGSLLGLGDPEVAEAARPSRPPAKRPSAPKQTITPPPAEPTIARINPDDSDKGK
ncbi:Hansenula MRAKII killer toxin-resistant protein 1 [Actinoplanes sp. NBC_00393]|uniref:Hansenula MRAKII killer toxin-resistant protein 1 n=1 Tax=Actinoplanes sp. NBC_00393 TaxID=2975953 RepID=UPI002E1CEA52